MTEIALNLNSIIKLTSEQFYQNITISSDSFWGRFFAGICAKFGKDLELILIKKS